MLPLPPFAPLLETAEAITTVLAATKDLNTAMAAPRAKGAASISQGTTNASPFKDQFNVLDAPIHAKLVPILEKHGQLDKAALLEAAFKLKLIGIQDELGTSIIELKDAMFRCLDLLLRCSELELLDPSTPLNYIEEVLDFQTVDCCEHIYDYIESRDARLTVGMVAVRGKGLTLLRLCNELLRRLSKANNTMFRARILMFQSSLFPLTERSGVNLKGDFNTENVTLIEADDATVVPELSVTSPQNRSEGENRVPNGETMDIDKDLTSYQSKDNDLDDTTRKDSLTFYAEFWGLQVFFCNPATLMNSPENITKLQRGIERTLAKFAAIEEAEQTTHEQASTTSGSQEHSKTTATSNGPSTLTSEQPMRNNTIVGTKRKHSQINESLPEPTTHFPKFLTSPKLLQLEMVDPYFRKHILVQFLIIIQYLESHTANAKDTYAKLRNPNKSLQPHWVMEDKDQEWAASIKPRIFKELKATGEESGDNGFLQTVNAVLSHEESWVQWKAEGCSSFEKPPLTAKDVEETRIKRAKLSAALEPFKQKLGCFTLTTLWKTMEEPPYVGIKFGGKQKPRIMETYLNDLVGTSKEDQEMRPQGEGGPLSDQEAKELEQSRLWRSLRLGSRQYLHIYGKTVTDTTYSIAKLAADVKEDEQWEKEIKMNGGKVPAPKVTEVSPLAAVTDATSLETKSSLESTTSEKRELTPTDNDGGEFHVGKGDHDIEMKEAELPTIENADATADKEASKAAVEAAPIVISLTKKE